MNSIHKDVKDDVGNNDGNDDDNNGVKHNVGRDANNYVKQVIHDTNNNLKRKTILNFHP